MKLQRLVPSMLVLAGGIGSLWSATADERNVHFATVRELVEAGMRLPAERSIEEFQSAGYPDAQWYHKGLRYAYADFYRTAAHEDIAGPLEQEYNKLRQELEAAKDTLPAAVKSLVDGAGDADLRRYVHIILRDLNPHAPPPLVPFTPEKAREFKARLQRLLQTAERSLGEYMAAIKAYESEVERSWDLDPESKEYQEIFQKAVLLRYDYADAFYTTYKALREVIQRGEEFGLDPAVARETVEPWLYEILSENYDEFSSWEWTYADVYPLLKHRMAVMLSEAARLNEQREDLGGIRGATYDGVRNSFYWVVDLDLSQFGRKFQEGLTALKYEAWSDLLFWHLAMDTTRALDEAARIWEDYQSRSMDPLNHPDSSRQQLVGQVYILAARIFNARQENPKANALCVEIQQADNYFAPNAGMWITFFATDGSAGAASWAAMPTAENPNVALPLARELMRTSRRETDPVVQKRLLADAQVVLRNAILGLPNANDPEFVEIAPRVYQQYAYSLYQADLLYEAVIAAEEGIARMKPLWERSRNQGGNPWRRGDGLTSAGDMVQTLSNNLLIYTQRLRARDTNDATRDAYGNAIAYLRVFDPERAEQGLEWNEFINWMQQEEYTAAEESLRLYEQNNPDQELRILGAWARLRYAQFNSLSDRDADDPERQKAQRMLNEKVAEVRAQVQGMMDGEDEIPEADRSEINQLWRFLTTVEVATKFGSEQYLQVVEDLDEEFWVSLQDDRELNRQLFNYLSASAYQLSVNLVRDQERARDPQELLKLWPYYTTTVEVYEQLVRRWPELADIMTNNRRQIAAMFNMTRRQTQWFQDNVEAGTEGFEEFAPKFWQEKTDAAQGYFARVFPITENTDAQTILSVGMAHWNLGNREEAVPLLERYKEVLEKDPSLQEFRDDPQALIDRYAQRLAPRSDLRPFWERRGEQSIPDLLIDEPGLRDMILDPNVAQDDLPEAKRNFPRALRRTEELGQKLQGSKALIPDFEGVWATYEEFHSMVQTLAYSIRIDTMLVEAYRLMGRGPEAVELARQLWSYDPLNPTFMTLIVEGTLESLKAAQGIDQSEVRSAQEIAARLRNLSRNDPDNRDIYWIASTQVMELSHYLGETDLVNRILRRNRVDNNLPIFEFSEPGSEPPKAKDAQAVEICARYLAIFDLEGVDEEPPFAIVERDGDIFFEVK